MMVTQADAKKIIGNLYPDMAVRLSKAGQIGIRPVYDPRPSLAWAKVDSGRDSAVKIGRVLPNLGGIDWTFSLEQLP